jgi:hypothetical protein
MAKMKRRAPTRRDAGNAFLPEPGPSDRATFIAIWDAESAAEEFIAGATSASFVNEDARNEIAVDELGGPFLEEENTLVFE